MVANRGLKGAPRGHQPVTEDDETSYRASRPITLKDHTDAVVVCVERFAETVGMAGQQAGDLRLAAELHGLGKADERYQILLAGTWWNRPDGPVLAKSGRPSPRDAAQRAGLPNGWRHEARSVHLASTPAVRGGARSAPRAMANRYASWGNGRPFFGFYDLFDEEGPHSLGYTFDNWDWPTVFERLRSRYGVWRLAWLEAVLRLADHPRASGGRR